MGEEKKSWFDNWTEEGAYQMAVYLCVGLIAVGVVVAAAFAMGYL